MTKDTPFLVLPALGRLDIRCAPDGRAGTSVLLPPLSATTRVAIRGDGRRLAAQALQPGQRLNGPLGRYRTQIITLAQSTEPKTIRATIELRFTTPRGLPCGALPSVRVLVTTASHFRG